MTTPSQPAPSPIQVLQTRGSDIYVVDSARTQEILAFREKLSTYLPFQQLTQGADVRALQTTFNSENKLVLEVTTTDGRRGSWVVGRQANGNISGNHGVDPKLTEAAFYLLTAPRIPSGTNVPAPELSQPAAPAAASDQPPERQQQQQPPPSAPPQPRQICPSRTLPSTDKEQSPSIVTPSAATIHGQQNLSHPSNTHEAQRNFKKRKLSEASNTRQNFDISLPQPLSMTSAASSVNSKASALNSKVLPLKLNPQPKDLNIGRFVGITLLVTAVATAWARYYIN